MKNNALKAYQDSLSVIYSLVSANEYIKAETRLLSIIDNIIQTKAYTAPEILHFIQSIYTDFNATYYKWLAKSGTRIQVQLADLYTKEHNNYLIGNCTDPAAMDDLLYELIQCSNDAENTEVNTHYTCYVTRLRTK